MENNKLHTTALKIYINLCRFVLAGTFVFSGFVKANDPLGFGYKLADYLQAFGWESLNHEQLLLSAAIGISTAEFVIGIYLLVGINRRLASRTALLLMAIMTPLTGYIALYNPVADCGCFGDAIILTNWQTFYKNIILSIMAISIVWKSQHITRFITRRSEWMVSLYSITYICCFALYCLGHLPVFDFRPYHIGSHIKEGMSIPEGEQAPVYETIFIMEKDGLKKEFTIENYPDSGWTFVDRKTIVKEKGYVPPIHDFALVEQENGEDITEMVLDDKGYTFLLVVHQVEKADDSYIDLINEIYEYSIQHGYSFYALTASGEEQIEAWKDNTGGEYPFCMVDDITLKTIVRANPGIVLLKDGTIANKWNACDLPDEYVLTDRLEKLPIGQVFTQSVYRKIETTLLSYILPLLAIFLLDRLVSLWRDKKRLKH